MPFTSNRDLDIILKELDICVEFNKNDSKYLLIEDLFYESKLDTSSDEIVDLFIKSTEDKLFFKNSWK